MDKNQAMFEYLLNCKDIKDTQLYFNIVDAFNNRWFCITYNNNLYP